MLHQRQGLSVDLEGGAFPRNVGKLRTSRQGV